MDYGLIWLMRISTIFKGHCQSPCTALMTGKLPAICGCARRLWKGLHQGTGSLMTRKSYENTFLWWHHDRETVATSLALCARNPLVASYSKKAWAMALHNEEDWRMETWQRARRASCHVSICQSPSCVMPFWTHAKCLLAFISYLPMWIKAKYTFIKTVYSPRFYGRPYMQAKHADICSGVLFWTACTRRTHVLSLPSRCEKSDSWRQSGSVKTAKKSWTVPQCGHVTLNCVEMASKQAKVEFSLHIFQFTRLHGVAVMQGLTFWDFKSARQVVRTVRHWISCCAPTIGNVMRECKIGKSSPHQPYGNTCHSNVLGVIVVALNGKSASNKNKLKQWLVIKKSVNKCNFFPDILKL